MSYNTNFKIHGSGPTGALLALALASNNLSSILIDPNNKDTIKNRNRAYAITHSTRKLLLELNLWHQLLPKLNPFSKLTIYDENLNKYLQFSVKDLTSNNRSSYSIGWILEHKDLMDVLFKNIKESSLINEIIGTEINNNYSLSQFEIAADGPSSKHRNDWNLGIYKRPYKSVCITCKVLIRGLELAHAYEIFRTEGPLAILPLGQDIFQVIWTTTIKNSNELCNLSNPIFLDRLATALPKGFEPDFLIDKPTSFNLDLMIAKRLYRDNCFLIGESAHRYHPIGGQGLNVCFRDIKCLNQIIKSHHSKLIKRKEFLFKYSISRYPDILFVGFFTHTLLFLYSSRNPILLIIRYPILKLLNNFLFLRRFFLGIMTDGIF